MSTRLVSFFFFFVEKEPEVAKLILASYVRAINWIRIGKGNLKQAAEWVRADG